MPTRFTAFVILLGAAAFTPASRGAQAPTRYQKTVYVRRLELNAVKMNYRDLAEIARIARRAEQPASYEEFEIWDGAKDYPVVNVNIPPVPSDFTLQPLDLLTHAPLPAYGVQYQLRTSATYPAGAVYPDITDVQLYLNDHLRELKIAGFSREKVEALRDAIGRVLRRDAAHGTGREWRLLYYALYIAALFAAWEIITGTAPVVTSNGARASLAPPGSATPDPAAPVVIVPAAPAPLTFATRLRIAAADYLRKWGVPLYITAACLPFFLAWTSDIGRWLPGFVISPATGIFSRWSHLIYFVAAGIALHFARPYILAKLRALPGYRNPFARTNLRWKKSFVLFAPILLGIAIVLNPRQQQFHEALLEDQYPGIAGYPTPDTRLFPENEYTFRNHLIFSTISAAHTDSWFAPTTPDAVGYLGKVRVNVHFPASDFPVDSD